MKANKKTVRITILGMLTALIVLMAFTPLGYLKMPGLEITFLQIPVVIGAIVLGPAGGAVLGGIFGLTSFIQCFGASPFGAMLLGVNPFFTFIVCMIPRILMGYLSGLIFKGFYKKDKTKLLSFGGASLSAALLNTILFVGLLSVFFSATMLGMANEAGMSFMPYLVAFVGINGLVEAIVCAVLGTAISKAIHAAGTHMGLELA